MVCASISEHSTACLSHNQTVKRGMDMKRISLWIALLALLSLMAVVRPARAQEDVVKQADAAWNEKSYARALELYRKALAAGAVRDRDEVEFRIAVSLGKTQKWDEAIEASNALLAKTEWK